MVRQTREQGVKLSIPARFRLPPLPGAPLKPRTFTSIYYDSTDLRLARAGVTLRRRIEARRSRWQLKLHQGRARLELESRGGAAGPPRELRDLLFVHVREDVLAPVATLRTRRTGVRVCEIDGMVAEVTLDHVTLREDGRVTRRWAEAEVEQAGDDPEALSRLEVALRAAGAGDHDQRPKLFQALEITPGPLAPPSAEAPAADHLAWALQQQVASLLTHDPGVRLGTDPEALHQMRVATRRLRAYLRAARPILQHEWADALREELGWLGRTLGPARDLDVMQDRLRTDLESLGEQDNSACARLFRTLERERQETRRSVLAVLRSDRYLKLIDHLRHAAIAPRVTTPAGSLPRCAAGEFKRLRKAMKGWTPSLSDEVLHRLRIRVKRARYAAELALPAVGKTAARFIDEAKGLQDQLGEHQDAVAAEHYLRRLLSGRRGVALALTSGMIIEHLRRRRRKVRTSFASRWKRLAKRGHRAWGTWLTSTRGSDVARLRTSREEPGVPLLHLVPDRDS